MSNTEPHEQPANNKMSNRCHWIPCSIDHDGLAPVHVYFRPESIPKENETASSPSSTTQGYAASFRGRGLIAASYVQNNLPKNIVGSVMMPTTATTRFSSNNDAGRCIIRSQNQDNAEIASTDHNKMVVMKERFDRVLEWEHESDDRKIIHKHDERERINDRDGDMDEHGNFNTQTQGSFGKGLGIFEILRSVHDPIPT